MLASIVAAVMSMFVSTYFLSTAYLSATIFIATITLMQTSVVTYNSTIHLFLNDEVEYWIQLINFLFGVGAMSGPFLVFLSGLHAFKIIGLAHLFVVWLMLRNPLPDLDGDDETNAKSGAKLSMKSSLLLCLIFFFYATQELGMASWISTYSIKAGIADI
jgi:hypothetical protein